MLFRSLQNPPEEIGALVAKMREGFDYVGTIRKNRQDSFMRRWPSRLINHIRERTTRIKMTDQGCMLRAYSRNIINAINNCREVNTFIPALAYTFARNPTEIEVAHDEREITTANVFPGGMMSMLLVDPRQSLGAPVLIDESL